MAWTDAQLMSRARRSYELGRLPSAFQNSWLVGLVVIVGALGHSDLRLVAGAGATLFILTALFSWRGQGWARALWPGYGAGAIPLLLPSLAPAKAVCRIGGSCWPVCELLCPVSGLIAGLALGVLASRQNDPKVHLVIASTLVAAATGAIGCALAGLFGIAGMLVGGSLGFLPVYLGAKIAKVPSGL